MWFNSINIYNIRSIRSLENLEFSSTINIFIGKNNSGKSTLLRTILKIQDPNALNSSDITINQDQGHYRLYFEEFDYKMFETKTKSGDVKKGFIDINLKQSSYTICRLDGGVFANFTQAKNLEPNNLIYPFLSKRKVENFSEVVNIESANSVSTTLLNLNSKIDRIASQEFESNPNFRENCKDIFGFPISSFPSSNGKRAGLTVGGFNNIPLESLGDGVSNILGLLVNLCVAEKKIFLIEEPENDIQPDALKKLLNIIVDKSKNNQFFITTHSNIVLKYLGSLPDTKIFKSKMELFERIPITAVNEIKTIEERTSVLREMGYELMDFDLWEGWLILEEASAETFISDYFIKWYAPKLRNKLRTVSARGKDRVISLFDDFQRLFLFIHLAPSYRDKAWVIVDNNGGEIITKLKEIYAGKWKEENFRKFSKDDFEEYYPAVFNEDVKEIKQTNDNSQKQNKKKQLLKKVIEWINGDEETAKKEFETSASEPISILREIESKLI
jgi:predicted ATPase